MKKIYKNIIISITVISICTALGYTYSNLRKQRTLSNLNNIDNLENTKSTDTSNNTSKTTLLDNIKDIAIDSSNSIVPFSSDIVIYNSHPNEIYESGIKITDVGALINHKLNKEGLNSNFISTESNSDYSKSYQVTHDLITNKVIGYDNTILLDIHRSNSETLESDTKKITLVLAEDNPNFNENNKFAKQLIEEILKSNKVSASILYYSNSANAFNQELSNNAVSVEIGFDKSNDNYIEECIDALVNALKNINNI